MAKPNEIQLVRVYDAPVELVWEVWTDLKHVEKWWGPRGFTLTTKSKELRPGGKWIYTMHGPDGTDYPNITTYHEVVKHEKLVYDHGGNEERDKLFTVTVTFREENGKTVMTLTSTLPTEEQARAMKRFIKDANGNSTWDRLGEYLEHQTEGADIFLIHRSFEAKRDRVFEIWTSPDLVSKWNAHHEALLLETSRPGELVTYAQRRTFSSGPGTLKTTVTFSDEEQGTRVTVRSEISGTTEDERRAFRESRGVLNTDWNRSFDKLESLLTD